MALPARRSDALRWMKSGVEIQSLLAISAIEGVVVAFVAGSNGPGLGSLRNLGTNLKRLQWRAPGSQVYGPGVMVESGNTYVLEDGEDPNKYARARVVDANRIPNGAEASIHLAVRYENGLSDADVTAAEASAGDVREYTIDLENVSARTVRDVTVWIVGPLNGLKISDDGATWVEPDSEVHADALSFSSIAAGASVTVHCQRTTAMGAGSDPAIERALRASFSA
ncbi:MAG: hypothetical protein MI923_20420 [Phycisphaerales bacterium]|nr:hypothetical protein [Phycisphaerales bacterium]